MCTIPADIDDYKIEIPLHFGKYDFIRFIGHGSFSVVILVNERGTDKLFACKICSRKQLCEKNIFDRFEREVRLMQSFRHPSIVRIEDVVFDQNLIYLVMEYCSKGELFNVIAERGKFDENLSKRIFAQIVDGLSYIHAKNIAHRDLKPENIMIDENFNAKIIDFGLCHHADSNHLLNTPCGSPLYAPPEIISGKSYDGKAADVWSIGVVLYTMVTGALPWKEANQKALYKQITEADFVVPRTLSLTLRDLILRLMRPDPKDRPQVSEIIKHIWIMDAIDEVYEINAGNNQFILEESRSTTLRKTLVIRPNIQANISSFSGNHTNHLIRKVPPSGKNQSSFVRGSIISRRIHKRNHNIMHSILA